MVLEGLHLKRLFLSGKFAFIESQILARRHGLTKHQTLFLFGPFALYPETGLFRDERLVSLPPKEFTLLKLLVHLRGQVASHADIEKLLWPRQVVSYTALTHCVYSLRRLLGPQGKRCIQTVPKRGYRLSLQVRKIESPHVNAARRESISTIPLALSHYSAAMREANDPRPAAQVRAILLFEEAAKVDSGFASAHAAVADTRMYQLIRGFLHPRDGLELGLQACHQALDINPNLAQGLAALGWFEGVMMRHFDAAHATLDQALTIDPDYSRGHMYRSWLHRCQGQPAANIEAAQRAVDTDPHALLNRHSYCWALFCGGRADEALKMERVQQREYPQDEIAQGYVALFAAYLRNTVEANAASKPALQLSVNNPAVCAAMSYVMARTGKDTEARRLAEFAYEAVQPRAPRPMIAPAYVELGDQERGLALLQEAYNEGCAWLLPARLDPRLKKLESDPRFTALFT